MENTQSLVDYQEPLSLQVGRFLHSRGCIPLNDTYAPLRTLTRSPYLLLGKAYLGEKQRTSLFGLIKKHPGMKLVYWGKLYFQNDPYNMTQEKRWVLEVHNKKRLNDIKQIASEIAQRFNVGITLMLLSEELSYDQRLETEPLMSI